MNDVIRHYDRLVAQDNDPFRDPPALRAHMNRWDGDAFFELLSLKGTEDALEIGVGTGRLAAQAAPRCRSLWGIDISPRTIGRARENLAPWSNVRLVCGDFLTFNPPRRFDAIYSSLTFMHFPDKQAALNCAAGLLRDGGRFALSIARDQSPFIDMGSDRLQIFPDHPETISACARAAGLRLDRRLEIDFAHLLLLFKDR